MLNQLLPDCITSSLYSQGPSFFPTVGHKLGTTDLFASSERKIFSKIRVQSNVATHIQESIKSIQRYCSNSFMGVTKQQAIDIFLGNFRPEVVEMTSSKSSSYQKENCGCLKALYLKNLSRYKSNLLWYQVDAGHRTLCFSYHYAFIIAEINSWFSKIWSHCYLHV